MINSEKFNLNLKGASGSKLSEQEIGLRSKAIFKVWTYIDVVNFIEVNFEDSLVKEELLKVAKKYPHSAYPNFIKNIQKTVSIILSNRSEAVKKTFKDLNKNKIIQKNMEDIKTDISIEEEIRLELIKEKELSLQESKDQKIENISQEVLQKEFD